MYNKFFGFKEKPFKLVPNPEYLFLSKSHEEALAHLTYAISHGDGFVEITGEVGTGKTTLCRVFLGSLDDTIDAAYIFNPKLDAIQLLKAINDEFGIDSSPDNTKDLIDILNLFLIEKKAAGQKVLVLIDEAQNLSLEVLEQLRLLSNLETTQDKLLQIILVGQPELGDMLASHQLRQLGQRITINCQLDPLTFQEAMDYIRHRISLASHRAGPPFDKASFRAIYDYSKGVPRLINIACDRVLLNAFSRNSFKITGAITREAIKELRREKAKASGWGQRAPAFALFAFMAVGLAAFLLYFYPAGRQGDSVPGKTGLLPESSQASVAPPVPVAGSEAEATVQDPEKGLSLDSDRADEGGKLAQDIADKASVPGDTDTAAAISSQGEEALEVPAFPFTVADPAGQEEAASRFLAYLKGLNARHSRNSAMLEILKQWNPDAGIPDQTSMIETDQAFFREAAAENNLQIQPLVTDSGFSLIENLGMPAILTFYLPNHAWPQYLAVMRMDENNFLISSGDGGLIPVDKRVLLRFWSGEAHLVWNNFNNLNGIITGASEPSTVRELKELLHALGYNSIVMSDYFDPDTEQAIKEIQAKNGLNADGMVGPLTKIALYNESPAFSKPGLKQVLTATMEQTE